MHLRTSQGFPDQVDEKYESSIDQKALLEVRRFTFLGKQRYLLSYQTDFAVFCHFRMAREKDSDVTIYYNTENSRIYRGKELQSFSVSNDVSILVGSFEIDWEAYPAFAAFSWLRLSTICWKRIRNSSKSRICHRKLVAMRRR